MRNIYDFLYKLAEKYEKDNFNLKFRIVSLKDECSVLNNNLYDYNKDMIIFNLPSVEEKTNINSMLNVDVSLNIPRLQTEYNNPDRQIITFDDFSVRSSKVKVETFHKIFLVGRMDWIIGGIVRNRNIILDSTFLDMLQCESLSDAERERLTGVLDNVVKLSSDIIYSTDNFIFDKETEKEKLNIYMLNKIYHTLKYKIPTNPSDFSDLNDQIATTTLKYIYNDISNLLNTLFSDSSFSIPYAAMFSNVYRRSILKYHELAKYKYKNMYENALIEAALTIESLKAHGYEPKLENSMLKLINHIKIVPERFIWEGKYYKICNTHVGSFYIEGIIVEFSDGGIDLRTKHHNHPNVSPDTNIVCVGDENRNLIRDISFHNNNDAPHSIANIIDSIISSLYYINLDSPHWTPQSIFEGATLIDNDYNVRVDDKKIKSSERYERIV